MTFIIWLVVMFMICSYPIISVQVLGVTVQFVMPHCQ